MAYLIRTCADVFPYDSPMAPTTGSKDSLVVWRSWTYPWVLPWISGTVSSSHFLVGGAAGFPSGEYAIISTPRPLQWSISCWLWLYGFDSIWLTSGLWLEFLSRREIWNSLKFETPNP